MIIVVTIIISMLTIGFFIVLIFLFIFIQSKDSGKRIKSSFHADENIVVEMFRVSHHLILICFLILENGQIPLSVLFWYDSFVSTLCCCFVKVLTKISCVFSLFLVLYSVSVFNVF
jgi:hypothetical protein